MPIIIGAVALVVIALIVFLTSTYKVADVDKALIITGGKEPIIKISGGAFVIPIFRKADYFDLCMLTVKANKDEIRTVTSVPIVVDWTCQIRPDTSDIDKLKQAIISFKERGQDGIINDIRLTLTGAVRDIVASMTPEAVLRDKVEFARKVKETVSDEMMAMGMELVSLNIQDISDDNGYYDNIAALDMEDKRLEAEKKKAIIGQDIRRQKAESEKIASHSELAARLEIAEKVRDNEIKQAGFKAETDKANADAAIAGVLQKTIREQEVAEQQGRVEVVKQEQANLAAQKEKEVIVTRAQAEKERKLVEAEAEANVRKIEANAGVEVAEKNANAVKITADAEANKVRLRGEAEADIAKQKALAEAAGYEAKMIAEANGTREKLIAEAEGERQKLLAQAEGERALADARASNEKVNFEIEKLKIESQMRIEIATRTAQIMADIGKNAEFVNIGGSGNVAGLGDTSGNVLIDTLKQIPGLMKTLDVENKALNGRGINDEVKGLVGSVAEPLKGIIGGTNNTDNSENDKD
ncbi:MAG: hypothetical protein IJ593_11015 [Lachnospiraceae bacterium]|nr:hypothetical protein [Lachnospiraceae bacterium]